MKRFAVFALALLLIAAVLPVPEAKAAGGEKPDNILFCKRLLPLFAAGEPDDQADRDRKRYQRTYDSHCITPLPALLSQSKYNAVSGHGKQFDGRKYAQEKTAVAL